MQLLQDAKRVLEAIVFFKGVEKSSLIGCRSCGAGRDEAEGFYLNTRLPNSGTKGGENGIC